jgi:hypothetical protein
LLPPRAASRAAWKFGHRNRRDLDVIAGRFQPLDVPLPGGPQRARDLQTAQTVLLRETEVRGEHADKLLARARAAQGIFHPSLITLFDVLQLENGRLLLVYEFVQAQPIALVTAGQPLNPRRAAAIVSEVSDAVAELHAREVVHAGISPNTVLVTMKGKAKLDRIADPSLHAEMDPSPSRDLIQLGDLLAVLVSRHGPGGIVGAQAIDALVARARRGSFESAATLAAMLRRISG